MIDTPKIDLSKVPTKYFINMMIRPDKLSSMFDMLNAATDGAVLDMSLDKLPALMANLTKELQDHSDSIAIAISSMRRHLTDNEE